jgi:hypothetical protein
LRLFVVAGCVSAVFASIELVFDVRWMRVDRGAEEEVGRKLRTLVGASDRVLVSTQDYGYFAVIAAFGRPDAVAIDLSHDPREGNKTSVLASHQALSARLSAERATWIVAPTRTRLDGPRELFHNAKLAIFQ